jgi:hypothetical protein
MIACLGCFGQAVMTTEGPFKNLLDHLVRRCDLCRLLQRRSPRSLCAQQARGPFTSLLLLR